MSAFYMNSEIWMPLNIQQLLHISVLLASCSTAVNNEMRAKQWWCIFILGYRFWSVNSPLQKSVSLQSVAKTAGVKILITFQFRSSGRWLEYRKSACVQKIWGWGTEEVSGGWWDWDRQFLPTGIKIEYKCQCRERSSGHSYNPVSTMRRYEDLGWIPQPKREYTRIFSILLEQLNFPHKNRSYLKTTALFPWSKRGKLLKRFADCSTWTCFCEGGEMAL